mgnify:CR=1 FL=1
MADHPEREYFIPIRVQDLIEALCQESSPLSGQALSNAEQRQFRRFADTATTHIHAIYLEQLRRLKEAYAPYDPDLDTPLRREYSEVERAIGISDLFTELVALLERANYVRLSREQLEAIMHGASDWGVDMDVAWDCFDKLEIFIRGKGLGKRTRRKWYRWFRRESVTVPTFQRVVIMLKQAPHRQLGPDADTSNVFMKLFKDIPQMDIEMLLPGTRIKMPMLDRLKLGGSTASTVGYIVWKFQSFSIGLFTGLLSGTIGLATILALYTPLALIVGYGYRTYSYFQVTKQTYQLQLTQSLYYQNLDNNAGVLYRILDEAEDQEVREVLLAYFYLWRYAGDRGWTASELDDYIELELERRLNLHVDFEIADALEKLNRAGIVHCEAGRYRAMPIDIAQDRLDDIWEKYAHSPREPKTALASPSGESTPAEPSSGVV